MKSVKKAIIPAAGYGTRSLPITKVIPKEMFPICGKPAIHYIVEEAAASGIEEILMIVSRNKSLLVDYFDRSLELEAFLEKANKMDLFKEIELPSIHIQYVRQPQANGLGGAIYMGKRFAQNEPVAVMLPDNILISSKQPGLRQLMDIYEIVDSNIIALKQTETERLENYGVIQGQEMKEGLFEITDIIEKPKHSPPSNLAVIGRYILEPEIFAFLERQTPCIGEEIQLTDAIKNMLVNHNCYGLEVKGESYDIGFEKDYVNIVNRYFNEKQ